MQLHSPRSRIALASSSLLALTVAIGLLAPSGSALAAEGAAVAATGAAAADADKPDEETPDYGARVSDLVVTNSKPAAVAPTTAPLQSTEPTSIISRSAIDQFVPATADYTQVVLIAPSMSGIAYNGPGFSEAKTTLRGFQDGEYNITYDGIPFGDANGPTHHSTSFFPSSTIGAVVVDRGPGDAGQLGQANFGGSINLFSPEVSHNRGGSQLITSGSWNTLMSVTKLNSGEIPQLNNARILLNFQELQTDGTLTYSGAKAYNQLFRAVVPINDKWRVTLFGTFNQTRVYQNDNFGSTLAQITAFGKNFALSNDPTSPTYYKYNVVTKHTDFDYIRFNGELGSKLAIEDTIYTYHYMNDTESALDTTITPAQAAALKVTLTPGGVKVPGMPAYTKLNEYRIYGNILRANYEVPFGVIRSGLWIEHSDTGPRARFDYDAITGQPDYRQAALGTVSRDLEYNQLSHWDQYQPFVDVEWKATPDLTITPGIKYIHFDLGVDSEVNQKTRTPLHASHTFQKTLYFLTGNYKFGEHLAFYGQYATGFLVPDISVFQVANPNVADLKPQESKNYQAGVVYHGDKISVDLDAYQIDFKNKFSSTLVAGETVWSNIGGVVYKGLEGQISYLAMDHLSLFANGSLNSAKTNDTKLQVKNAPKSTAALGVLYRSDLWTASISDKYTGKAWADGTETPLYELHPFSSIDIKVSRAFGNVRLEAAVYNLFDNQSVVNIKPNKTPPTVASQPLDQYYFEAERNFQVSAKLNF